MSFHYRGKLYRALNPIFAREPLSGDGAARYGGRFNPKGIPALYTSLSVVTALAEANQVGTLQPTTLVCLEADIGRVFDCRDHSALMAKHMDTAQLADPCWRDATREHGEASTQTFARRLMDAGYHGLLVPSYTPAVTTDNFNLVLWVWAAEGPSRVTLIDDENRLSPIKDS